MFYKHHSSSILFSTQISLRFLLQTFCSNADFTKVNIFLFMYMNSRDVIICYLELRKTRSVFPIPLEFEISKFACISLCRFGLSSAL